MERGAGRVKRGSQGLESTPVSEMPTDKKIKIWEIAKRQVFQSTAPSIKPQKASNIKKKIPIRMPKVGQNMSGNVFYGLCFVLSGRFGDWYMRLRDSGCIQKTLK